MALVNIDIYSNRLVRFLFDDEILVNDAYNDPTNYRVQVINGSGPVEVVGVLPINKNTSLDVILITQPLTAGTTYVATAISLTDRNDVSALYFGNFIARVTKIDSVLRSIPKHFDKRSTSLLSSMLQAVGKSDDTIGGSRKDSIEYV